MIRPTPPKASGIAGLVFLFCVVGVIAGVGFDVMSNSDAAFGLVSQPGARGVLGVGVAVACALVAQALRFALGRAPKNDGEGDASDRT